MAKRACAHPGCRELVRGAPRCPEHTQARASRLAAEDVQRRGSSTARGYDAEWRRLRDGYYQLHSDCELCLAEGRQVPAQIVDHIVPHRGDDALRLAPSNLQSLCLSHHRCKTISEGAGYRAPQAGGVRAPPGPGGGPHHTGVAGATDAAVTRAR